jgi:hypothetical protein
MKKNAILILTAAFISQAFTLQSREITVIEKKQVIASDSVDNMTIIIGNDFFRFDGNDSLVLIKVGDRGLSIQDSPAGKKVDIEKYNTELRELEEAERDRNREIDNSSDNNRERDWKQEDLEEEHYRGGRHFRGHWAGMEAGFNNYLYAESITLPDQISFMSLNASNSNCFNLNFSQVNIGFSRHTGFVTGIGLNWNNYRFEGLNSITVGNDGVVNESIPDGSVPVKKSKFNTLYLNFPLMFEVQIPAGYSGRLNIAAGVIGGIKLNAWTKLVYEDGEKVRTNGDYNLNLLRGGVTARIGYENFMLYGTYYLTPWFQDLKGPNGYNLEPFEIGLAFTFND